MAVKWLNYIERSWIPHTICCRDVTVEVVAKHYSTLLDETMIQVQVADKFENMALKHRNKKVLVASMVLELFEDGNDGFKPRKTT